VERGAGGVTPGAIVALNVHGVCPLIQVFDMPASLAFYCDVLGFEIVATSSSAPDCDWAWLKLGGADVMLNTAYEKGDRPSSPDPGRIKAHEDTALFFSCPDVDAAYAHLRGKGVAARPPVVQAYGMKQLYIHDPDGYNLCFQWKAS
jgi:catechol 2,3-dioxygenase-like lactoylglutathione lyase family enzyme